VEGGHGSIAAVTHDPYEVDARFYDLWHPPDGPDIGLWQSFAARTDRPVLEVGVGTGRIALALARAGFDVVGVDPSAAMLAVARAKADRDALDVQLIEGRLPELTFEPRSFGLVLFPLDVFLAFATPDEQLANLAAARRLLHFDGLVILDLPGPAQWLDPGSNGQPLLVYSGVLGGGERLDVWHVREDDLARQERVLRVAYELTAPDGTVRRFLSEHRLRYLYPAETEYVLRAAGLAPTGLYGDYELGPLTNDSERMIVVARGVEG
jgi:ubiquinone/menaquinone biosynthesis C-methylase UbiE